MNILDWLRNELLLGLKLFALHGLYFIFLFGPKIQEMGDCIAHRLHSCFSPAAPGLILGVPQKNFRGKLLMLVRLNNAAGLRKVDRGLKMLIEPI